MNQPLRTLVLGRGTSLISEFESLFITGWTNHQEPWSSVVAHSWCQSSSPCSSWDEPTTKNLGPRSWHILDVRIRVLVPHGMNQPPRTLVLGRGTSLMSEFESLFLTGWTNHQEPRSSVVAHPWCQSSSPCSWLWELSHIQHPCHVTPLYWFPRHPIPRIKASHRDVLPSKWKLAESLREPAH